MHILTGLHPSLSLAGVVKDIKIASSDWIKKEKVFNYFEGWQEGYGAFTCAWKDKNRIMNYIANQIEHHQQKTFREEYIEMLQRSGIEFDPKFLC